MDKVFSDIKVGDIWKVKEARWGVSYITIVFIKCNGFYCYRSNEVGDFLGNVHHSNMYLGEVEVQRVGRKEFKEISIEDFHFTQTGIDEVDTEMANLDDRYILFLEKAPLKLKNLYDTYEDSNYHRENALMVKAFAEHLESGKSPKLFHY